MKAIIDKLKNDALVNNSFYLILASAVTSLLGFVFWIISARLFNSEQVGLAATLIASMALINTLTLFGFDVGIIRFWKGSNKKNLVSSCHLISFTAALIAGLLFIFFFSSTKLSIFAEHKAYALFFILLSSVWVLFNLNDSVYIAMRKSKLVLIKHTLFSILKLIFPFILVSIGFFAIFSSYTLSALIALTVILIYRPIPFVPRIDFALIRSLFSFSVYNYFSLLFTRARELVLPLLVTYLISAQNTAYFYVAFNVTLVFLIVPKALSKALLAELSHKKSGLRPSLKKSMLITLLFAVAVIAFVFVFGKYVLLLYGSEYAQNSLNLLYLFAISGVFAGINELYFTLMRVQLKLKQLLAAQIINASLTIFLSVLLISQALLGIGVAWLVSEVIVSGFVIAMYWKLNPLRVMRE